MQHNHLTLYVTPFSNMISELSIFSLLLLIFDLTPVSTSCQSCPMILMSFDLGAHMIFDMLVSSVAVLT
jgi:hypothetical protein